MFVMVVIPASWFWAGWRPLPAGDDMPAAVASRPPVCRVRRQPQKTPGGGYFAAAYGANVVPIGEDQRPNVEFAREIARRFNRFYGNVLVEPQPALTQAPKLPGTDGRKMSKSYGNTIAIFDSPKEVNKKLAQMQTDPARKRRDDPGEPNKCPVADLHNIFTDAKKRDDIFDNCRNASIGCVECKRTLADTINNKLAPVRDNRAKIDKPGAVEEVLKAGAVKARAEAEKTLCAVRRAMALR